MNKAVEEVWKPIKGYEGRYEISNRGRVKHLLGWNGRAHIYNPHIIKGSIQKMPNGYNRVVVNLKNGNPGRGKDFKVHRLVAEAFLEKPKGCNVVNHKDFDPTNNNVENLEWVTDRENHEYSTRAGRRGYLNIEQREELVEKYLNGAKSGELQKEYKIRGDVVRSVLRKHGVKAEAHRGRKYNIDLGTLLQELQSGMTNVDLAKKYKCPSNLIARRRYQFRKEGIIA